MTDLVTKQFFWLLEPCIPMLMLMFQQAATLFMLSLNVASADSATGHTERISKGVVAAASTTVYHHSPLSASSGKSKKKSAAGADPAFHITSCNPPPHPISF